MTFHDDADQTKLLHPIPCPNYVTTEVDETAGQFGRNMPLLFVYTAGAELAVTFYSAN